MTIKPRQANVISKSGLNPSIVAQPFREARDFADAR